MKPSNLNCKEDYLNYIEDKKTSIVLEQETTVDNRSFYFSIVICIVGLIIFGLTYHYYFLELNILGGILLLLLIPFVFFVRFFIKQRVLKRWKWDNRQMILEDIEKYLISTIGESLKLILKQREEINALQKSLRDEEILPDYTHSFQVVKFLYDHNIRCISNTISDCQKELKELRKIKKLIGKNKAVG